MQIKLQEVDAFFLFLHVLAILNYWLIRGHTLTKGNQIGIVPLSLPLGTATFSKVENWKQSS